MHGVTTTPFRLRDPRQLRIHERLRRLVSTGAADAYYDGCRLMSGDAPLRTITHLVAHLLREVESSLRQVLLPIATDTEVLAPESDSPSIEGDQQRLQTAVNALLDIADFHPAADTCVRLLSETQSHAAQIRSIARRLGLAPDDRAVELWLDIAGKGRPTRRNLAGWAHRDGLESPRPLDESFADLWEVMQYIFGVILEKFEAQYLSTLDAVDRLLTVERPTRAHARELRTQVPNSLVVRRRFFDRLKDPAWLPLLRSEGFFKRPPVPETNPEQGTVWFPPWPESQYLARMAAERPGEVLQILLEAPLTDNIRVLEDFLDAALAMPPDLSAQLASKAATWTRSPYSGHLLPDKLGALVAHLAQGGKAEAALGLAAILLEPLPDPLAGDATTEEQGA